MAPHASSPLNFHHSEREAKATPEPLQQRYKRYQRSTAAAFIQSIVQTSTADAKTTTSGGPLFTTKETDFSYLITASFHEEVLTDGNITQQSCIDQKFQRDETDTLEGIPIFKSSVSNDVTPTDLALFIATPNGFGLGPNSNMQELPCPLSLWHPLWR